MRALCAALLVAFSCALQAQPREHEVKAAFVFKFPSFVEWPREAPGTGPLVIGVAGADAVAAELEQVATGRTIQGRAVAVRRLRDGEQTGGLHVLFLGQGQAARLVDLVRQAPAQPLLIVCEWQGALQQGAVVNFVRSEGRVRFEVALDAAERRGLRISARMLAVAQNVLPGKL
jgi:hypothetical protein